MLFLIIMDNYSEKDMHMSFGSFCGGVFFVLVAVFGIVATFIWSAWWLVATGLCGFAGIMLLLMNKNQWAILLSDDVILYSNIWGRQTEYRIDDLQDIRVNPDSRSLIFSEGKMHIDSGAVLTERFVKAINNKYDQIARVNKK